jgi:Fur family peroxide stress response transcriptional regulator
MITGQQLEKRVEGFLDACRRHGVRVTRQRTEILRELAVTGEHPDAETLYRRVRRRVPAMSLDTIYRTLRMLEEKRVISRVGSVHDRARFDPNADRHHHFVCGECGMIGDFYSEALDRLTVPREAAAMGSVDGVYVELRGRCRKCHTTSGKRKERSTKWEPRAERSLT